ncbi:hypothetical protein ACFTWF_32430 [Rhodococcus sp. NPDC056960]|uniref:hypothetical protein n=1 Tax=Rhodococcus sp. NPDC056960 TaxID=3345982 RepID=UPI0036355C82
MKLYECKDCDFSIAGSEPSNADDEFELRQDIEAHEEFHRDNDGVGESTPAAAVEALRLLAELGMVVLPVEAKPLTRDDVRAIVREEIRRIRLPDSSAPIVGVVSGSVTVLENFDSVLGLRDPTLKTDDCQHQRGNQARCAECLASRLLDVLDEFVPDGRRNGELVRDRQSLQMGDGAQEDSPSVGGSRPTVGDRLVSDVSTASSADAEDSGSDLKMLARGESLLKFIEPLCHSVDHLGGSGGSRVVRREGMEGLVDRLHPGERFRDRIDSAREVVESCVGSHPVFPPSVDSGVTTVGDDGNRGADASSATVPSVGGES